MIPSSLEICYMRRRKNYQGLELCVLVSSFKHDCSYTLNLWSLLSRWDCITFGDNCYRLWRMDKYRTVSFSWNEDLHCSTSRNQRQRLAGKYTTQYVSIPHYSLSRKNTKVKLMFTPYVHSCRLDVRPIAWMKQMFWNVLL